LNIRKKSIASSPDHVWRLDIWAAARVADKSAIRATSISRRQIKATLLIQKNLDAALSASHTITVSFSAAPDAQ